ncbi:hypothetical protein [Microbacterium sp. T32]|uniref:hypothetical protein n=1 Tax=Microbacterium sp. T32 TaxID=1776083 RepID=UPI0007ABF16A|nr:hypothetical protein [Microbacterium sp. T32]KZE41399.1 hypothetical protein AVW09_02085 [Microbacterium sp. T32]
MKTIEEIARDVAETATLSDTQNPETGAYEPVIEDLDQLAAFIEDGIRADRAQRDDTLDAWPGEVSDLMFDDKSNDVEWLRGLGDRAISHGPEPVAPTRSKTNLADSFAQAHGRGKVNKWLPVREYRATGEERIAFEGEIWLVDESGEAVNLTPYEGALPHGVFAPVNSDYGIERDDELAVFESDFDAAAAIRNYLTTITGQTYSIWYDAEQETTP